MGLAERAAAAGLAVTLAFPPAGWSAARVAPPPDAVECTLADGRHYRLANVATGAAPRWALTLREPGREKDVRLLLPGARPEFAGSRARLHFRTANGGIIVHLDASPERSTLDVYVSYELEVNVDVSLSPDIDRLNTDGEQPGTCRVPGSG